MTFDGPEVWNDCPSMQLTPRIKLLLLFGVFALPIVAAYLAYFGWRPSGHTNYGELLKTAPLQHINGKNLAGLPLSLEVLRGKWVMLHVGPAKCEADCVQQLYLMRQIRIAQGKEQSRIARLWVVTGEGEPDAKLLLDYPNMYIWHPNDPEFLRQFPADQDPVAHIYLVDPLGNLMLSFPAQPNAKGIMKDLRLLLNASQIG